MKIIIIDSDVPILALYFASKIKTHIYLEMGTGAKVVVYDITSNTLEHDICEALPGLIPFWVVTQPVLSVAKCLTVMKTQEEWIDCIQMLGSN